MSENHRGGSYRSTTANVMRAFDRLPAEARVALANAVENWVAQPLLTQHRRGILSDAASIVQRIELWNRLELAKLEHQRSRAIGPFKGNTPDPAIIGSRRLR